MYQITQKEALKRALEQLPYHLERYEAQKYQYEHARTQKIRSKAFNDMITSSKFIENVLTSEHVYDVINDGNQFQFEDFFKFAASDTTGYIRKIQEAYNALND